MNYLSKTQKESRKLENLISGMQLMGEIWQRGYGQKTAEGANQSHSAKCSGQGKGIWGSQEGAEAGSS